MATEADGFFSRWSRRKAQAASAAEPGAAASPEAGQSSDKPVLGARSAAPRGVVVGPVGPVGQRGGADTPLKALQAAPSTQAGQLPGSEGPPPPTLDDVAQLTAESDFKPFVGRSVPTEVKNAAMKKLFADPHFNVMDGLDIYIDDYSKPNPLPAEWLQKMVSAQVMKLVEEEVPVAPPATAATAAVSDPEPPTPAPGSSAAALPQPALSETPPLSHPAAHDHPDLQLQPDHATRRGGTEPGAG